MMETAILDKKKNKAWKGFRKLKLDRALEEYKEARKNLNRESIGLRESTLYPWQVRLRRIPRHFIHYVNTGG